MAQTASTRKTASLRGLSSMRGLFYTIRSFLSDIIGSGRNLKQMHTNHNIIKTFAGGVDLLKLWKGDLLVERANPFPKSPGGTTI